MNDPDAALTSNTPQNNPSYGPADLNAATLPHYSLHVCQPGDPVYNPNTRISPAAADPQAESTANPDAFTHGYSTYVAPQTHTPTKETDMVHPPPLSPTHSHLGPLTYYPALSFTFHGNPSIPGATPGIDTSYMDPHLFADHALMPDMYDPHLDTSDIPEDSPLLQFIGQQTTVAAASTYDRETGEFVPTSRPAAYRDVSGTTVVEQLPEYVCSRCRRGISKVQKLVSTRGKKNDWFPLCELCMTDDQFPVGQGLTQLDSLDDGN